MNQSDGSYQFDRFQDNIQVQEQQRLEYQSQILLSLEQRIWTSAGLTTNMEVLDLGCGTGKISRSIGRFVTAGSVLGIDRSPTMVVAAQASPELQEMHNIRFQVGDSEKLDLPTASFNFVYARLLFQHLRDPQLTLSEIRRVLKPGGIVCLVDIDDDWSMIYPRVESMQSFREAFVRIQAEQGGDANVGRKLGTYLSIAGFAHIKTAIEMVTSDALANPQSNDPAIKSFLDLFSFGAAFQHQNPEVIPIALQFKTDAYKLLELPYAWGGFGLFVATGVRL